MKDEIMHAIKDIDELPLDGRECRDLRLSIDAQIIGLLATKLEIAHREVTRLRAELAELARAAEDSTDCASDHTPEKAKQIP